MFGENARHELLRLAIPRRVYTQSHIDYLVEAILEVNAMKDGLRGFEIISHRRSCGTSRRSSARLAETRVRAATYNLLSLLDLGGFVV